MSFPRCERGRELRCFAVTAFIAFAFLSANAEQQHRGASEAEATVDSTTPNRERLLAVPIQPGVPPLLPANVVAAKLVATSARRSSQLRGYRATRDYHLQYRGLLGTREASMQVLATYTAPDKYDYTVVAQSGSRLLINRVLLKLLDSEREALRNRSQVDLSPANYDLEALGIEILDSAGPCYVLGVRPRKDNKFLYRGKIWVDAEEFAVVRMEGQPAKSPSFWIKDTDIDSNWQRLSGFWFIQHTRSVSHIRLGGTATLTIDYRDYQITAGGSAKGHGQSAQLPDPGSVTPLH
jgi:hypothetical protein